VTEVGGHHVRMKDESQWIKIPDHTPKVIDKDVEYYLRLGDDLVDYVRLEFTFRRRVLKNYLHQPSVTVADIMQEQFQIDRINKMITRLGLHRRIVSRSHMKQHLDKIFIKRPTRQKAGKYISMLNSRGTTPPPFVTALQRER